MTPPPILILIMRCGGPGQNEPKFWPMSSWPYYSKALYSLHYPTIERRLSNGSFTKVVHFHARVGNQLPRADASAGVVRAEGSPSL